MTTKLIEVPDYVAETFSRPLRHPSTRPDAIEASVDRVYRLVNEALKGINSPDWEVGGRKYHSSGDAEPYGFERIGDKFYVYAEERGRRTATAIFKDDHVAAKYFVWLVSKGTRTIDWQLFLDMEP